MKIVSKRNEKDYYDNGAVYGIDETKIYVRQKEEFIIKLNTYKLPKSCFHERWSKNDYESRFEILGFCGKIFLINNFSIRDHDNGWYRNPKDYILIGEENIKYSFKESLLQMQQLYKEYEKYEKKPEEKKHFRWNSDNVEEIINKLNTNKELQNIFIEYKTPIFHIGLKTDGLTLTINPLLKDYGFFRIKDTIQTFQEIEMFLGSVLVSDNTPVMPVGDDKVIASSKGFDKWSFRKMPN